MYLDCAYPRGLRSLTVAFPGTIVFLDPSITWKDHSLTVAFPGRTVCSKALANPGKSAFLDCGLSGKDCVP